MSVAPKFLDLDYKIHLVSDHVAKFHGDLPRNLGDLVPQSTLVPYRRSRTVQHASRNLIDQVFVPRIKYQGIKYSRDPLVLIFNLSHDHISPYFIQLQLYG